MDFPNHIWLLTEGFSAIGEGESLLKAASQFPRAETADAEEAEESDAESDVEADVAQMA